MSPPLIGIIAGRKATDALLCRSLEQAGFRLKIIHYKIPVSGWLPWIAKRINERGLTTFIGHVLLAVWLRLERFKDTIQGKSLWKEQDSTTPSWDGVSSPREICMSEKKLIDSLQSSEAILFLDGFRVSHRFFRRYKKPCFQIVWGSVPSYLGDSGGYWAYLQGEPVCVSLIARREQFDQISPITEIDVPMEAQETLRTIKIKQAIALSVVLPKMLSRVLKDPPRFRFSKEVVCRLFYAPTLWTYLRTSFMCVKLPQYAVRERACRLYRIDKPV